MGISFEVSKFGKRFRPKPPPPGVSSFPVEGEKSEDVHAGISKKIDNNSFSSRIREGEASDNKGVAEIVENEVSFCLNLFPDGYSVAKPMESASGRETSVDVPKFLHPYDRASETMFSAIESGRLPGDILDDLPCKYVNGTLVCEVRDYRKCSPEELNNVALGNPSPIITRVCLRMSLENIVKDIPNISDNDWTYGDLIEVESRILKALQPQLSLDPTPKLDKLSNNPGHRKLNFELRSMRRKRLMQLPEVAVTSNNLNSKKVCLERAQENSRLGDPGSLSQQTAYENSNIQNPNSMLLRNTGSFGPDGSLLTPPMAPLPSKYPIGLSSPRMMRDQRLSSSSGGQDMMIPFAENNASSIHGKRENQDGQSSPLMNKKARPDGNLQHLGLQMDGLHGSDLHWKNTLMRQQLQQSIGRGIHPYPNANMQKFPQQAFEGSMNQEGGSTPFTIGQQGVRFNLKEEPVETERLDRQDPELTGIDPRLQQRMPAQLMRSGFPQGQWSSLGQTLDNSNNPRKDDLYQKRKLVQSPRVSAGGLPQSPLSSRSGEFSSGSHQFGGAVNSGHVSQKEKSVATSIPTVGGSDLVQRQNQVQAAAKRRSNSLPKTPAGVASPASVSTMNIPISASSPHVGSQALGDQSMLERFSKIEVVTMRCQLKCKKNKVDEYPLRKPNVYSAHNLMSHLSSDGTNDIFKDETYKLSKSLVAGSMNSCKTRILNFFQTEHIIPGNSFPLVSKARMRLIMSEKPNDGNVAFYIGEIDDPEYMASEEYLPTLPNAHIADLLASQFISLMAREGYDVEDHLQPKATCIDPSAPSSETQQFSEDRPSQPTPNDPARSSGSTGNAPLNSPQNVPAQRMLPPGNNGQPIEMSQGLLPGVSMPSRPQQLPPEQQQQQLPPQQSQFQRSPMMLPSSSMQHLGMTNMHQLAGGPLMGNNKHSSLQLHLLQQQQQQQQRKMMATNMGNIGNSNNSNNMVGLGGLGGMMVGTRGGMGGGSRMPSGVGPSVPGIGNVNLSSAANITNAIRNGTLTPEQATLMKLRLQQSRAGMGMGMGMNMGMNMTVGMNMMGGSQPGIGGGGAAAARQMHSVGSSGLSMLGPALARAGIGQMQQRTAMGQMGPPKLMPGGVNPYMNQQQQQQIHLQQQQQQQQMQLQQQQQLQQVQQQQETNSPMQVVVSPQQVGSPSGSVGMGHQMSQQQLQQQQASPQQRTPMSPQLSSGANAMHQMAAGANQEVGPASPQLSSQTMGSVGSITNSPVDANKSSS